MSGSPGSLLPEGIRAALRSARRQIFEWAGSDRYSRLGLDGLDVRLDEAMGRKWGGYFVEAGANDGLSQSNTYRLERFRGWTGILIEPIPALFEAARRNRPHARVINAALVADDTTRAVSMRYAHLMSIIEGARGSRAEDDRHIETGRVLQGGIASYEVTVPARTLSAILAETGDPKIDLLVLDAEGYELEALRGLDLDRHAPQWLLIESDRPAVLADSLGHRYRQAGALSHHDYLFERIDATA
jgi:FkbM family methyltransferase